MQFAVLLCFLRLACFGSQRSPIYNLRPILVNSTGSCENNQDFMDAYGQPCSTWELWDCSGDWEPYGYSEEDMEDIRVNCPAECGLCMTPERQYFRDYLQEVLKDWTWCSDNAYWFDYMDNKSCKDWANQSLAAIGDNYSDDDKYYLSGHCGATLGTKSCSICEDNPDHQDHCNDMLGSSCITDSGYRDGGDRYIDAMIATAGNCPASCGLCDRQHSPSNEELLLSCTNDPILEMSSRDRISLLSKHCPFYGQTDDPCDRLVDCNRSFFLKYIPERMPDLCNLCIPPSERLDCKPGTIREFSDFRNLYCKGCALGTFSPIWNTSECLIAPIGQYVGVFNASVSSPCQEGTYSAMPGKSSCDLCPRGRNTFGMKGQTYCHSCLPGTFSHADGSAQCDSCPRGRYANSSGVSECFACEGSHRITAELGASAGKSCICSAGYFEIVGTVDCHQCLDGMTCPLGSSMKNYWSAFNGNGSKKTPYPLLLPGFFAWEDAPLDVFLCASQESCVGGALVGESPCCIGCHGLNCGLCEAGLFHSSGVCKPCLNNNGWQIPCAFFLTPLTIGIFHHFLSYRAGLQEVAKIAALGSVSFGTVVFSAQALGVFSRLMIDWPDGIQGLFEGSTLFIFNFEVLRASCTFSDSLVIRFGLPLIAPMFVASCFFALLPISFALASLSRGRFPKYSLPSVLNGVGMLFQAMYISLVVTSISIFECYESPNDEKTLRLFPFIQCGTPEHTSVIPLGVTAIVLYVIGFLSLCIVCNYIAPRYFPQKNFNASIRFLILKFRPSTWWYGIVLMLRSALIGLVTAIEPNDGSGQFYLMICILFLGSVLHVRVSPYNHRFSNNMELLQMTFLILILLFGSWFIPKKNANGQRAIFEGAIMVSIGFVVLISIGMLAFALYSIIFENREKGRERERIRATYANIVTGLATLLALSEEELESFLVGCNYVDHWHLLQVSHHVLTVQCGIQGNTFSTQRLTEKVCSRRKSALTTQQGKALSRIRVSSDTEDLMKPPPLTHPQSPQPPEMSLVFL